jgi:nicotinate phosphoribosyltransferase
LETALLNIINFQTLIATKASRVCNAAGNDRVVEFGLRRAQGIDGGISASRAAYIGGCAATSNVLAGKLFGIPVIGTHAHSWVMSFSSEEEAFEAYAQAMPNNCVFLVDTYDTINGIRNAIKQGLKLRQRGFEMIGIRLDSGNLAELSIQARQMLDEAGFPNAQIIASNDLDEYKIALLKKQSARINSWGVGTQMVTSADQSALGGVYKLGAVEEEPGRWVDKIKLSNDINKVTNPGVLEVWRDLKDRNNFFDIIANEGWSPQGGGLDRLLVRVFEEGKCVYTLPKISDIRKFAMEQLTGFDATYKHRVYLEPGLANRKAKLVEEMSNYT